MHAGQLKFFGQHRRTRRAQTPSRSSWRRCGKIRWYVYGKRPFAGPEAVLTYLSRYTHRVAIANSRLIAVNDNSVTFKYKDYRVEGPDRYKVMTLAPHEFIRRFLIHVLPKGFHRIRHYGLFAKAAARTTSPRPAHCSPSCPRRRPMAPEPRRRLSRTAPVSCPGHARTAAGA